MSARQSSTAVVARRRRGAGPTTRGGWTYTGTAADRRANAAPAAEGKGSRTRQRLLDAARRVFAQRGYVDATVEHIVGEAGLARGSFYTYFESKAAIFHHLAIAVDFEVTRQVAEFERSRGADPVANLEVSNRRYLDVVRANADIYAVVDQVASFDAMVKRGRLRSRQHHVRRVEKSIRHWQRDGYADPSIDALTTAAALVSMLSSFAQWRYAGGDVYDDDTAASTLTSIWVKATGLRSRPVYGAAG